jgi:hypothetical protein
MSKNTSSVIVLFLREITLSTKSFISMFQLLLNLCLQSFCYALKFIFKVFAPAIRRTIL